VFAFIIIIIIKTFFHLFLKFYETYIFLFIILSTSNDLALNFFNFALFKINFIVIIRIIFIIFFKIVILSNCLIFSMGFRFLLNIKIFIRLIFIFLINNLYLFEKMFSIRNLILIIFYKLNLLHLLHFCNLLIFLTIC